MWVVANGQLTGAQNTVAQLTREKGALETDKANIKRQLEGALDTCKKQLNAEEKKTQTLRTELGQLQGMLCSLIVV